MRHHKRVWKQKFKLVFSLRPGLGREGLRTSLPEWIHKELKITHRSPEKYLQNICGWQILFLFIGKTFPVLETESSISLSDEHRSSVVLFPLFVWWTLFNPFHSNAMFHFYSPWKRLKTNCFLTFSGAVEVEH